MIDIIEEDIKRIRVRLSELEADLVDLEDYEYKLKGEIRRDLIKFETELTSKLGLLHRIRQDYEVKNKEIEVRIDKMQGNTGEFENMADIYKEVYGFTDNNDGGE